ncbi:MAG: hypothetical protein ACT4TC_06055 [Myxococcaceae bacterium]
MLPALALLPLLVAGRANYEVAARSEARATTDTAAQAYALVDLTPRLGLRLQSESVFFNIAYAPRAALTSGLGVTVPEYMHRAELGFEYAFTPGHRFYLRQDGAYGMREFTLLGVTASTAGPADTTSTTNTTPPTPTPSTTTPTPTTQPTQIDNQRIIGFAPYVQSSSRLGLVLQLSKLTTLLVDGGYEIAGGADSTTRLSLPLQKGPRADAQLTVFASNKDTLITAVSASDSVFSNGRSASLLVADERWRRMLGRVGFGELRLGASAQRQRTEFGTQTYATLPVGGVAFESATSFIQRPLALRLELNVVPYIDPYATVVYQRLEANTVFTWKVGRGTVIVRGSGSYALTGFARRGQSLLMLDVGGLYLFDRIVQLEGGLRGAYQAGTLINTAFWAAGGYIALGFAQVGAL